MIEYGYKKYDTFKPIGNCVLIKKLEEDGLRKSFGLFIPQQKKFENNKIGVGEILDISKKAIEKTGAKIGDFVLYDYYSVFNDTTQNVLTNYENLIMILTKEEAELFLKGEL